LKEEALDCIKWGNRFRRGCGPVVWQITDDDDDDIITGQVEFSCTVLTIVDEQRGLMFADRFYLLIFFPLSLAIG
jgi:hypothetical protein